MVNAKMLWLVFVVGARGGRTTLECRGARGEERDGM